MSADRSLFGRAVAALRLLPQTLWVAGFMIAAQLPILDRTVVTLDEGQVTSIGHRLASGGALYRDTHTGLFPGLYWLVEILFRVFGTEVLVLRWTSLAVNTLTAVALFHLARPLAPGLSAWIIPVGYWVLVVLSFPVFTMLTYSPLSLLAGIGALLFCRRYVLHARLGDGIATGALLGLATIFKQNFGALALLAVFVSALWTRREGRLAEVPLLRAFAVPVAGGLAVAALALLRLAVSGSFDAFIHSTFVSIVGSQMDAFNQPLPPVLGAHPEGGVFYFLYGPGAMFGAMFQGDPWANTKSISAMVRLGYGSAYLALALAPLLAWKLGGHRDEHVRVTARVLLPFAVLMFPGIFPSAIWSHLVVVYPPLLAVLAAACSLAFAGMRLRSPAAARVAAVAAAAVLVVVVGLTARLELGTRRAFTEPLGLPSASLHVSARDAMLYQGAAAFLRECAAENEPVFVAPYMPLLYVVSGRPNATPYDLLISIDVQETVVIERMQAAAVKCVVFNPQMYVQFQPFEQTFPKLSAYLAGEFVETGKAAHGDAQWNFLRRRDSLPAREAS